MENIYLLVLIGLFVGTIGTLIGVGGGFIIVPFLILINTGLSPESITAVSMAVIACNAVSGSAAYMRSKRIDFKAGLVFAAFTIPGSILGVMTTKQIDRDTFDILFGILLFSMAVFLYLKGGNQRPAVKPELSHRGWVQQRIIDRQGNVYEYAYDIRKGSLLSLFVGYFSPVFGIGGGIVHVPAMTEWLKFPVHIATATSQFILGIMAIVSVVTHFFNGSYKDPLLVIMIIGLALGVIPGAQLGAYISRRIHGRLIVRILSIALGLIGLRILFSQI